MLVSTVNFQWTRLFIAATLGALNARPAAALLGTGPAVHLYTGTHQPTPDDVPTTYSGNEATFTGYAPATPTFPLPGPVSSSGGVISLFADCNWIAGVITGPGDNVTGYWITDSAGDLVGAELFASPIPIVQQYDSILLSLYLPLPLRQTA